MPRLAQLLRGLRLGQGKHLSDFGMDALLRQELGDVHKEIGRAPARIQGLNAVLRCLRLRYLPRDAHENPAFLGETIGALQGISAHEVEDDIYVLDFRGQDARFIIDYLFRAEGLQVGYVFHAGDGNFHPLMLFDDRDPSEMARVRRAGAKARQVNFVPARFKPCP